MSSLTSTLTPTLLSVQTDHCKIAKRRNNRSKTVAAKSAVSLKSKLFQQWPLATIARAQDKQPAVPVQPRHPSKTEPSSPSMAANGEQKSVDGVASIHTWRFGSPTDLAYKVVITNALKQRRSARRRRNIFFPPSTGTTPRRQPQKVWVTPNERAASMWRQKTNIASQLKKLNIKRNPEDIVRVIIHRNQYQAISHADEQPAPSSPSQDASFVRDFLSSPTSAASETADMPFGIHLTPSKMVYSTPTHGADMAAASVTSPPPFQATKNPTILSFPQIRHWMSPSVVGDCAFTQILTPMKSRQEQEQMMRNGNGMYQSPLLSQMSNSASLSPDRSVKMGANRSLFMTPPRRVTIAQTGQIPQAPYRLLPKTLSQKSCSQSSAHSMNDDASASRTTVSRNLSSCSLEFMDSTHDLQLFPKLPDFPLAESPQVHRSRYDLLEPIPFPNMDELVDDAMSVMGL